MNRSLFDLARKLKLEKASREFRDVREAHGYTAARRLMDEVFADFPDVDHSFVREFQTAGFSARVLELALFAALREQGKDWTAPAVKYRCDASAVVSLLSQRQVDDIDPLSCVYVVALDGMAVRSPVAGRDISAGQRGDTSYTPPHGHGG